MNNYCIYLKKKKGQPFCKLLNEEIPFCRCRECGRKEYKTKNLKISFYKTKPEKKQQIIKKRSKKLVKKEKNRYSVFTSKDKCFVCDSKYQLTWNEIFRGRNRINSMKYGFCLRMCLNCHRFGIRKHNYTMKRIMALETNLLIHLKEII